MLGCGGVQHGVEEARLHVVGKQCVEHRLCIRLELVQREQRGLFGDVVAFNDLERQEPDDGRSLRDHRLEPVVDVVDFLYAAFLERNREPFDQCLAELLRGLEDREVGGTRPLLLARTFAEGEVANRLATDEVVDNFLALCLERVRQAFGLAQNAR